MTKGVCGVCAFGAVHCTPGMPLVIGLENLISHGWVVIIELLSCFFYTLAVAGWRVECFSKV